MAGQAFDHLSECNWPYHQLYWYLMPIKKVRSYLDVQYVFEFIKYLQFIGTYIVKMSNYYISPFVFYTSRTEQKGRQHLLNEKVTIRYPNQHKYVVLLVYISIIKIKYRHNFLLYIMGTNIPGMMVFISKWVLGFMTSYRDTRPQRVNRISISHINSSQIAKFMGPTWGPPGSCRPKVGPMLAQWTLLSGIFHYRLLTRICNKIRRI